MIFRQFQHFSPVAASYLFGCGGQGRCVVVDPIEDIEIYLQASDQTGMRIVYVIDTHVHADHLSGGRRLAESVKAPYLAHESAGVAGAQPGRDGEELTVGNVSIHLMHTPGHTPEHLCLLVTDRTRGPEPWLVVTGHTLMVGDMGRTELAGSAEEGAHALFDSAARLRVLADHVEVWPGAFAGSVCGRGLSGKASSTIGFERRFNQAFRVEDRQAFVDLMICELPPPLPNAQETRAANLGIRVTAGEPR